MENRERDKVSRNSVTPTDAGEVNRNTSQRQHDSKSSSGIEFGEQIAKSERMDTGSGRSSGSGSYGSSSGNSSSTGGRH